MKKYGFILFTIILSTTANFSYAQNLIPNYSFELYDTCPYSAGQVYYAPPWVNPANPGFSGTPDYYNNCNTGGLGVPNNFAGFQLAKDGSAYFGLFVFLDPPSNTFEYNAREYFQVQLTNTLVAGECYRLKFFVSLPDQYAYYRITHLSACFSNTAITDTSIVTVNNVLNYSQQFNYVDPLGIGDTSSWCKIEGVFMASGGEQFMTVGNFKDDANTTAFIYGASVPNKGYAYYYVDSMSLVQVTCPIDIGMAEDENVISFNLFPNPSTNQITLEFELPETDNVSIEIKNTLGQTIKTISNSFTTGNNKIEMDVSEFSNGVYFLQLQNGMKISNQKFIKQ